MLKDKDTNACPGSNIRIITDSACDITGDPRNQLTVLPMTITIGKTEYLDGVDLTHERFYELLVESDDFPKTSQVNPYSFEQEYRKCAEKKETAIVITLSSKLSGTYQSAVNAAVDYADNVYIVDSESVTVGQRALIEYAFTLIDRGLSAKQIADELNKAKKKIRLIALLDTLEYLKKGGRISSATAIIGNVLNIKPVIAIENGEVAMLGKARGSKLGNNLLIQEINKYGGIDFNMPYYLGYTGLSDRLIQKYIEDSHELWEDQTSKPDVVLVGATIGTHIGPGGIAVAFFSV